MIGAVASHNGDPAALPQGFKPLRLGTRTALRPLTPPRPYRITAVGRLSGLIPNGALGPAVPEVRSGPGQARAVRDPLVRARLYLRHPARLALCPPDRRQ